MTIREIIEARAREKATLYCRTYLGGDYEIEPLTAYFRSALIAILTDPQVGFKEALHALDQQECLCCYNDCVHSRAEAKLAELQEMEKVK